MALEFTTSYLKDTTTVFTYYKRLADRAMEQLPDTALFSTLDAESNSIAIIVKHMAGNMRSRWIDFLTSDGEKPDRNRDSEFEAPPATRAELLALWESGWKPLFEARHRRDVAPVQFALAGMNAHINHDLALGISAVCAERGVRPRVGSPEHRDYLAVNPLIADAEKAVKAWLVTGALENLDRTFRPVDDIVAVWSVVRARAAAWTRAEVLWSLRHERELRDEYVEINDRAVELTSRALLAPVGLA